MDDTHISDPFLGQTISHYHIESKLGEGGMGVVYKAKDNRLLRPVAIKFLSRDLLHDSQALKRFQHEAIAASAINHPNICTIYEIDSFRSYHFIVMEYVDGKTLNHLILKSNSLLEWQVLNILKQICDALLAAHEVGIIHRDIKPANIMVCDKTGIVKVMDFGLAKLASETAKLLTIKDQTVDETKRNSDRLVASSLLTTLTGLMGTATYMSPEQAKQEPMDHRTDIFSLGIVAFEMLTGTRPFRGESQTDLLESIVKTSPTPIGSVNPRINKLWQPLVDKALQKEVEHRYQRISDLTDDLEKIKSSMPLVKKEIRGVHGRLEERKRRRAIAFSMVGVLALVVSLFIFLFTGDYFSNLPVLGVLIKPKNCRISKSPQTPSRHMVILSRAERTGGAMTI